MAPLGGEAQYFVTGALPSSRHPCAKEHGCSHGSCSPGEQRAPRNTQVTMSRLEDPGLGPSPSLRGSQRRLSKVRPLLLHHSECGPEPLSLVPQTWASYWTEVIGGPLKASESVKTLQTQHGILHLPRNPPFSSPLEEIISMSFK